MRIILAATTAVLISVSTPAPAQTALCEDPGGFCGKMVSPDCLERFGAGPIAAAEGDCGRQLTNYQECVAQAAEDCGVRPAEASPANPNEREALAKQAYDAARASADPRRLELVANRFPNTYWGDLASLDAEDLRKGAASTDPSSADALGRTTSDADPATPRSEAKAPVSSELSARFDAGQRELQRLGLYSGPIDGDWGPGSQRAMRQFQEQAGIRPADGMLTQASLEALRAAPTAARSAAEQTPELGTFRECEICPEMSVVPAGSFEMGSPVDEPGRAPGDRERPQRMVHIDRFAIGKTEVTFAQWDACVEDAACLGHVPDDSGWGRGEMPVINVSWTDVQSFVAWLNEKIGENLYRLPSEAEWEYVARAGTKTPYWSGWTITPLQANYDASDSDNPAWARGTVRERRPVKVGTLPPNPWGIFEIAGNVKEWVEDCKNKSYSGAPADGSPWETGDCKYRMSRGGAYNYPVFHTRSASRGYGGNPKSLRAEEWGFRVARTLKR